MYQILIVVFLFLFFFLFQDELKLEYERYMTQVVSLLETDKEFKEKVEKVNDKDVQVSLF